MRNFYLALSCLHSSVVFLTARRKTLDKHADAVLVWRLQGCDVNTNTGIDVDVKGHVTCPFMHFCLDGGYLSM